MKENEKIRLYWSSKNNTLRILTPDNKILFGHTFYSDIPVWDEGILFVDASYSLTKTRLNNTFSFIGEL